jgi:hypothetical protein
MSAISNTGIHRRGTAPSADDVGIYSLPENGEALSIGLQQLGPAEARVSMPSEENVGGANPIGALTQFIGPALTVNSPAWSGDPVHAMRSLQKKLVEHSLTLDEKNRAPCLAAISVVEDAVQWRLRLQQMRMNDVERDMEDQARKAKAA